MRQDITPTTGTSLRSYFNKIQSNFVELYRKLISTEPGFTGVDASILTSGTVPEARINPELVRRIIAGTGEPPSADNLPEGTIYIKYE